MAEAPPNMEAISPIPKDFNGEDSSSSVQQNGTHYVQDDEHDTTSGNEQRQQQYSQTLEERVRELEEKLATLSILLQQNHRRPPGPPAYSPPQSPLADELQQTPCVITDDSFMMMMTSTPSGLLDSPPPQRPSLKKHVRNLSYRVLHTEDFAKTPDRSPPPACSDDEAGMTPHSVGMTISEEMMPTPENPNIFLPATLPGSMDKTPSQNATGVPTLSLSPATKATPDPNVKNENGHDRPPTDISNPSSKQDTSPMSVLNCSNPSQESVSNNHKETPPIKKSSSLSSTTSRDKSTKRRLPKRSNSSMSATAAFTSNGRNFFSSPSSSNNTSMKSKWLDYLNSVQESNYDTDRQMQEFVKVPNAVEGLLAFGFWMCVDSFLYTLTILPIRFVWSCLLLMRFAFFRAFRKSSKGGPDGPFRFHRR
jgi:hypothetical protein